MDSNFNQFVIGYHACEDEIAQRLLKGENMAPSKNDFDWLGHGIYFWENDEGQAWNYAQKYKKFKNTTVVGAVIQLGSCLDITTKFGRDVILAAHQDYSELCKLANFPLPQNEGRADKIMRKLDCAVFNFTVNTLSEKGKPIDTIRGLFDVGEPLFAGTTIKDKINVQISVLNNAMIKGIFLPR
jgi:hypothetical protein